MSTLDRAFAKAFAQDRGARGPRPLGPAAAPTPSPAAAQPQSTAAAIGPPAGAASRALDFYTDEQPSVEELYAPPGMLRFDLPATAQQPPHMGHARPVTVNAAPFEAAGVLQSASQATGPQVGVCPPMPGSARLESIAAPPVFLAATRPLSSFAAPEQPAVKGLCAALEVDQFAWPQACESISRRTQESLYSFAERLIARGAQGQKVVAITGCGRQEGRSTILLCLAQQLAAKAARCVVVDADLEQPGLARRLGVVAQAGWEDVMSGQLPLAEVLIGSLADRFDLLPLRQNTQRTARLTSHLRSAVTLGMLRDAYDLVLVDTGPVVLAGDPGGNAPWAEAISPDCAYLVYDHRSTMPELAAEACRRLAECNIQVRGIIENFATSEETTATISLPMNYT